MSKPKDDFWCFLHCSLLYFLREGLLLNLQSTDSSWSGWAFMWVPGPKSRSPCLYPKWFIY